MVKILPTRPRKGKRKVLRSDDIFCVRVNTVSRPKAAMIGFGEEARKEFGRSPSAEIALKKRLVAGKTRAETPIARVEHKP